MSEFNHEPREGALLDVYQNEFRVTREFWCTLQIDRSTAMLEIFPRLVEAYEADEYFGKPEGDEISPEECFSLLHEITTYLTTPNSLGPGIYLLEYNPIDVFGSDRIERLVQHGFVLIGRRS